MKYQCEECSFKWEGTSYTFEKVREHEKTHLKKNKITSTRCKVCNASKIIHDDQMNSNDQWECQTCGNLLDANGHVITSQK
jgi:ribosomal protein L37AE/L43A